LHALLKYQRQSGAYFLERCPRNCD